MVRDKFYVPLNNENQKNMKKITLFLSILALVIFTSCGDDDGDGPSVNNEITVGSQTYAITNGAFIDLGESEGTSQGVFAIADANITISASQLSISTSSTIRVVVQLISLGTGGLQSGGYELGDVLRPDAGQVFFVTQIRADGTDLNVDSGTVTLSGSAPNFTLQFDLSLDGGERLTGGYQGEFVTN